MLFFINDIPLRISKKFDKYGADNYDLTVSGSDVYNELNFKGKVLMKNISVKQLNNIVIFLQRVKSHDIKSVVVLTDNKKGLEDSVKGYFKKIEAGGGLVLKDGKFLMIHRLGIWDLPKGKLEEGEKIRDCAIREVEEECCISVELIEKVTDTWHSYTTKNGNDMLKKTSWYLMHCTDDSLMKPQIEESIDAIKWMDKAEVEESLRTSYQSIAYVFTEYEKLKALGR